MILIMKPITEFIDPISYTNQLPDGVYGYFAIYKTLADAKKQYPNLKETEYMEVEMKDVKE